MAINSNDSDLRVETNVNGQIVDNDDVNYRRSLYLRNNTVGATEEEKPKAAQRKVTRKKTSTKSSKAAILTDKDQALKQANHKDLTDRNIK